MFCAGLLSSDELQLGTQPQSGRVPSVQSPADLARNSLDEIARLSPSGRVTLLHRLDELEEGSEADRAAIATLDKRGITAAMRGQLRALVSVAQAAKSDDAPLADTAPANQQALEALHRWYRDWSETARAVIRRRDHLIVMGLAKRRTKKTDDATTDEPASPSVPVVTTNAPAATTTVVAPVATAAE
jgi:hypothetical protein